MKYAALLTSNADDIAAWEKMSPEETAAIRAEEVSKWEALLNIGWHTLTVPRGRLRCCGI